MPKTLSPTSIAYTLWPKERPKKHKRRQGETKNPYLLSPNHNVISSLRNHSVHSLSHYHRSRTYGGGDHRSSHHQPLESQDTATVTTTNNPSSHIPTHPRHTF